MKRIRRIYQGFIIEMLAVFGFLLLIGFNLDRTTSMFQTLVSQQHLQEVDR